MPRLVRLMLSTVDEKLDTTGAVETATLASAAMSTTCRKSWALRDHIPRTATHTQSEQEARTPECPRRTFQSVD
jgi:hypothetical protein